MRSCWMGPPPRSGKALSVNVVVAAIVVPTEPFGGRPKGAMTLWIRTLDTFSVSHDRTMFDDVPQPRAGRAVKESITGSPGMMTVAVNVADAGPQAPPGT